jgi:hypothetical protein
MVNKLIADSSEEDFVNIWQPRIIEITEKYLGKGKKVNQCTRDQVEMLSLIVFDLKDLIENN